MIYQTMRLVEYFCEFWWRLRGKPCFMLKIRFDYIVFDCAARCTKICCCCCCAAPTTGIYMQRKTEKEGVWCTKHTRSVYQLRPLFNRAETLFIYFFHFVRRFNMMNYSVVVVIGPMDFIRLEQLLFSITINNRFISIRAFS